MTSVGIVGIGKMGAGMARRFIAAGHSVVGCDPIDAARSSAADLGVTVVPTAREVAVRSEIVFIVVGFEHEVDAALFSADGILAGAAPGLTVAIGSTVAPRFAFALPARLQRRDIVLLDMPTARGEQALATGDVLIFGGGDEAAFARWMPLLRVFASDIFHLGGFGAGQVAKMVNNLLLWACMSANDEALRLAAALGSDTEKLRTALGRSSAQNWSLTTRAEDRPMPWAEKDMNIVLREADVARLSLPLAGSVKEAIKALKIRRGLGMPSESD